MHAVLRNGFIGIIAGRNWSFKFINHLSLYAYIQLLVDNFKFRGFKGLRCCKYDRKSK